MCGIVGFLARDSQLRASLGELVVPMLSCMGARGPDSAGLAVFAPIQDVDSRKYNLFAPSRTFDWMALTVALTRDTGEDSVVDDIENHAVLRSVLSPEQIGRWLEQRYPEVRLLSAGWSIDIYKDDGHPEEIARRYRLDLAQGSHAVGHTRMATESAVSPAHAHPFTAGEDFCLVHNGSLSNPYSVRRKLERKGIVFETDNDTEAACRFLEWRMREGDSLEEALTAGFAELDGFYTLLMATADQLVLVRDPFACKPAVVAETDRYVAISSEYRALAHLPGVSSARIFEPEPERIYSWTV
jgi:methylamine---glutamate N-methyltransferase subunit A